MGSLLALLAALVPGAAAAQAPIARFERLTIEGGHPQAPITAIVQDHVGFIWLGTNEGLFRYDGTSFLPFTHDPDDPATLPDSRITALAEDRSGTLWVGTHRGLSRLDQASGQFTNIALDPSATQHGGVAGVSSMAEDGAGALWVGTLTGAALRLDPLNGGLTSYPLAEEGAVRLQTDQAGTVWANVLGALYRFNLAAGTFTLVPLTADGEPLAVSALHAGHSSAIWVGAAEGLLQLDQAGRIISAVAHDPNSPRSLGDGAITAILEGRDGTLWVGTGDGGLSARNPSTGVFARYRFDRDRDSSLASDTVRTLFEDRDGLIWVGSLSSTVSIFDPATRAFQHYGPDPTQQESLPHRTITALHIARDGALWVGDVAENGLTRLDRSRGTSSTYRHDLDDPASLPSNRVTALVEDGAGVVWVGTVEHGLAALRPADGHVTRYRHSPGDRQSLHSDSVYAIVEDRAGALWAGTADGVALLDRATGRFRTYYRRPGDLDALRGEAVTALHETRAGVIWIGTLRAGLYRYERSSGRLEPVTPGGAGAERLLDGQIYALAEGPWGHLWIATSAGLSWLDPASGAMRRYTQRDGLPTTEVLCVLVDVRGTVWAAARKGLARLDPQSGAVRSYGARDGLQGDFFSSDCARSGDTLAFGGRNGVSLFDPQALVPDPAGPPVVLTGVSSHGEPLAPSLNSAGLAELALGPEMRAVTFEFAALDYANRGRISYEYMLEGFDEGWIAGGAAGSATYTNLDGGRYTFRARAAGPDGVWSEEGVRLALTVATPPWRTRWAYALYALVATALVGTTARAWTQTRATRILAAEVAERRRAEQGQQRLYEVASGLREVLAVINSNRPLPEVLQFIVQQACRLLEADAGQIYRLRPTESLTSDQPGTLRVEASAGISGTTVGAILQNIPLTLSYRAIQQRRPLAAADGGPTFQQLLAQPNLGAGQRELVEEVRARFRSVLAVPLVLKDEVYGTITLYDARSREFGEDEINLALAFARQSALAIENARLRQQAAQAALREERSRLARELHDSVTQSLYSLGLLAQSWRLAAREEGQPQAEQQYTQVVEISHQSLKEMRLLISQLRLPELEAEGLVGAVQRRLEAVERRVGIQARVHSDGDLDVDLPVAEQLYRIIQEALNNALKHARATAVTVSFAATGDGAYQISVEDNGSGFDPGVAPEGYGLTGMRERAAQIGASLAIYSAPGEGTTVRLHGQPETER